MPGLSAFALLLGAALLLVIAGPAVLDITTRILSQGRAAGPGLASATAGARKS